MKLHLNETADHAEDVICGPNFEGWFRDTHSLFKIDRMPSFDIRYSLFDIRYLSASDGFAFKVSFFDQTGRAVASGAADT